MSVKQYREAGRSWASPRLARLASWPSHCCIAGPTKSSSTSKQSVEVEEEENESGDREKDSSEEYAFSTLITPNGIYYYHIIGRSVGRLFRQLVPFLHGDLTSLCIRPLPRFAFGPLLATTVAAAGRLLIAASSICPLVPADLVQSRTGGIVK